MGAESASLSNLILLSTGASAVTGMAESFANASALRAAGNYENSMYERNAALARRDAQEVIRQGDEAAIRNNQAVRQMTGAQRAAAVSQGVVAGTGSAGEIERETERLGALDALMMRQNAARQAYGYDVQAGQYESAGRMAKHLGDIQGKQTLATGGLKFVRELASGAYAAKAVRKGEARTRRAVGYIGNRIGSQVGRMLY